MKYLVLALLFSCRMPTPAEEVSILKAEIKVSKFNCASYLLNMKYPRDSQLEVDCSRLTAP